MSPKLRHQVWMKQAASLIIVSTMASKRGFNNSLTPRSDCEVRDVKVPSEVIDLVSSDDENDYTPTFASIVTGKRSRHDSPLGMLWALQEEAYSIDYAASEGAAAVTDGSESTGEASVPPSASSCMSFLIEGDNAIVTDSIIPLLHRLDRSGVAITPVGCTRMVPVYTSLLHVQQRDKWSCGFRNVQMMLSEVLPRLASDHPFFRRVPSCLARYPDDENRPVPIPSLYQLQTFLEDSWRDGYDLKGAQHYRHAIVGKSNGIGAVEVATILSFLQLDSCLVQFIKCRESRSMLGQFVWNYFQRARQDDVSCCVSAERLLATINEACGKLSHQSFEFPELPLYLQWHGHSVTIVGVEKASTNEIHLLVFDPLKDASVLKQALHSEKQDVLAPMRLASAKFSTTDCQIVMCSPRALSEVERNARRDRTNSVTASNEAVLRHMQRCR